MNPRLVRDDRPVERPASVTLPDDVRALVAAVHGAGTARSVQIPADYVSFVRTEGGGFRTLDRDGAPDPYGWTVYRFSTALAATSGLYERVLEEQEPADLASVRASGFWLEVGGYGWRHLHYLCCDPSRDEFGQVYDLNDGDPATGMVPDVIWPSFGTYIG